MNCHFTVIAAALGCCVLYPSLSKAEVPMPLSQPEIAQAWQLAESGDFAGAEARLKAMIEQADAPVTSLPAIALEQLRRIRLDYDQTPEALLEKLKRSIPDVTPADLDRWRQAGELQYRLIDGQVFYFDREPSNLFRFCEEAKSRRILSAEFTGQFNLADHAAELLSRANPDTPYIFAVRHTVRYTITIPKDHPRVKPGAKISVWMPAPQQYDQQRSVQFNGAAVGNSDPDGSPQLASSHSPHRTLYFEQVLKNQPLEDLRHDATFSFTTFAKVPIIDETKITPYNTTSDLYLEYTTPRPPHIILDEQTRELAASIIGDETNPYRQTIRIFRWISENIRYCAEQEYSTIPAIGQKALTARKGDCGVQALTFITLCRAAGIPARWQSGFQTFPDGWNLHDWAEFYVEPYGWLPCDPSYGVLIHPDPAVQNFLCGHMDPFRWIVNLDYGREFLPAKQSFRSEPTDFQRGEVEIDGHNLYFGEWKWEMELELQPHANDFHAVEVMLDDTIPAALRKNDVPGVVIHIGRCRADGSFQTWEKAYGYRALVPELATMTTDTVFDLASLTKPLATGLTMLHLAEAGRVSLNDPISKTLPEFAEGDKAKATIGDLLSHQAGLPAYLNQSVQEQLQAEHGKVCPQAVRQMIRNIDLITPPGEQRQYSCLSAILAAEVIETITGQPLDQVFAETFAKPLGRETLGFNLQLPSERFAPTTPVAKGQPPRAGTVHDPLAALQGGVSGNAGLFGTAGDIAAIAQLLLSEGAFSGHRLLEPATVQKLTRPPLTTRDWKSCGENEHLWLWGRNSECAHSVGSGHDLTLGHTGYTGTMLRIYPELDLYLIVLTNRVHPDDSGDVNQVREAASDAVNLLVR
jgi:CubicO group peptidase (beta-lactamase class C family)/transglutaminase-like putative cysteine protease